MKVIILIFFFKRRYGIDLYYFNLERNENLELLNIVVFIRILNALI